MTDHVLVETPGLESDSNRTLCESVKQARIRALETDKDASHTDDTPVTSPDTRSEVSEPLTASPALKLAIASVCCVSLAAALDATSLSIALSTITTRVHGTAIQAFWAGTGYLVTCGVFQPVIGGLSHIFGRKEMVIVSCAFFFVGSLIGGLAHNFSQILAGRAIQGIGGAGILALEEILITDLIPLSVRGVWLGALGAIWALGSVVGPLMGGGFAYMSPDGWRWVFWINFPFIAIGVLAVLFFLKLKRVPGSIFEKVCRCDWIGSVLLIASLVAFLVPLSWGGIMYAWSSWHTLVPLIIGFFGIVLTSFYEKWLSTRWIAPTFKMEGSSEDACNSKPNAHIQPIVPSAIFRNATVYIFFFQTMIHGLLLWSLVYFLPLYYEAVKGYSSIMTGVAIMPETILIAPMGIIIGIIISKTGRYKYAIAISWAIVVFGFGILILLDVDTTVPQFIFLNVPVSIGTGLLYSSMSTALCATVLPEYAGHALTFYSFMRVFGQSLGVALSSTIFLNDFRAKLKAYPSLAPLADHFSREATSVAKILKEMNPGPVKQQLTQAFADSLKTIWIVLMSLSALAFILTPFIKEYSLKQEHKTEQNLVEKESNLAKSEVAV